MENPSKVYFLPWSRKDELEALIDRSEALSFIDKNDVVAIKMHFGEIADDGHIRPELVRPFIKAALKKKAKPYLTDTNTIYHGPRNNAVDHLKTASDHGFSITKMQVPVIISDGIFGDDQIEVEVPGRHFKKVKIAAGIFKSDKVIALSHFKGHLLTGFGGAIKNIGMGCASKQGKFEMHSSVAPTVNEKACTGCGACVLRCAHGALLVADKKIALDKKLCRGCGECVMGCATGAISISWNEGTKNVQEHLVEYAYGALVDKPAFYVNFANHITANCDCMGLREKPLAPDVGILASKDPVAIDRASLDMIIKASGDVFKKAHPGLDGMIHLNYAEEIGLGSQKYSLVEI